MGLSNDIEEPLLLEPKEGALQEWSDEGGAAEGFENNVKDIPEGTEVIRFFNSW